MGRKGYSS